MVKCRHCGAEVAKERKSWKMAGRPDKAGKRTELTIGLFDCPSCNKSFKFVLNKQVVVELEAFSEIKKSKLLLLLLMGSNQIMS